MIIGVLLMLTLYVGFNPVFIPVGIPVGLNGEFFAGFVNGGNQAHGGLSVGYGGIVPRRLTGGFGGGLSGKFYCKAAKRCGGTVSNALAVFAGIVVHDLGSRFGGPQVLPPDAVTLLHPLPGLCCCGDIGESGNLNCLGVFLHDNVTFCFLD